MQIQIEDIKIPDRVRKDVGNIDSLAESLKRSGQITPISVTHDMTLVAGFRRVTAAKRLDWKTIEANIVEGAADEARLLEIELEENVYRKDFTPEELLAGYKRLEKLRHPTVGRRIGRFFAGVWGKCAFWRRRKKKNARNKAPEAPAQIEAPQTSAEASAASSPAEDDDSNYGV